MEETPDIRDLKPEQIADWLKEQGEPSFRASQIHDWLWNKHASSFDDMTNLPLQLREKLAREFGIFHAQLVEQQNSADGTIKCAFKVGLDQVIEGVLIPAGDRVTACISSQVGCSLNCKFCATARLKLMKNLSAAEIFDQVVILRKLAEEAYGRPLTNIVYMGMGEPLLNYKGMLRSTEMIISEKGLGMSYKRITVSTAGIAKMIRKMADDGAKFNLALSLHAANDEKRSRIMDINASNNLEVLADALRYYHDKTGLPVTYEYIIFDQFNDTRKDALELVEFCKVIPSKVNIIEYNPIDNGELQQADPEKVDAFCQVLSDHGVNATIRRSRGKDIDAACGQLANKNEAASVK